MLPEKDSISNTSSLYAKKRQLNLHQRYESLIILPQQDTEDFSISSCKNCTSNQIKENYILDNVSSLQTEQNQVTQIRENIQEDPNKKIINDIQNRVEKEIAIENKQEENKNTNLQKSNINKQVKNQKHCIIL